MGGRDLKQLDVSWWRKQIGLVGQQPMLFDLTLEDLFLRFWLEDVVRGALFSLLFRVLLNIVTCCKML